MALPKMMQDVWDNHLDSLTPMMKMYLETKKQHDDCIIFYRLGDFYEMFFDDATTASKEMEITLTGKSCGCLIYLLHILESSYLIPQQELIVQFLLNV